MAGEAETFMLVASCASIVDRQLALSLLVLVLLGQKTITAVQM